MTCVCPAQLQPHDPLPAVCLVPAMDRDLPAECPRPFDPDQCYVWGGACKACATGDLHTVDQHDLGGEA